MYLIFYAASIVPESLKYKKPEQKEEENDFKSDQLQYNFRYVSHGREKTLSPTFCFVSHFSIFLAKKKVFCIFLTSVDDRETLLPSCSHYYRSSSHPSYKQ